MKLAKSLSLYTLVSFLNKGILILVLPVLTHYLTPADYGVLSLMNTYVQILIPVIGLSTASYITVEMYSKHHTDDEFRILFSSVRLIPLLTCIPLVAIMVSGAGVLPDILELPAAAYWLLLPLTLAVLYNDNFLSFLLATKRSSLYAMATVGKVVVELALTILLVAGLGFAWQGRAYGWLIAVALFTVVSLYFYRKWKVFAPVFSRKYIIQAITFGAPLILHQIGKFVINQSDRIFITQLVSREEMGIYSVGYQVGMVILLVATAFGNAFTPFLYECLRDGSRAKKLKALRVSYLFIAAIFCVFLATWLATPLAFRYVIGSKFAAGARYVPWIGLSYFFWSVYLVFSGYLFYMKKSNLLAWLALFNVGVNVSANYYFIQKWGTIGAAYATCGSFFLMSIIIVVIATRIYPMPWLNFAAIFGRKSGKEA